MSVAVAKTTTVNAKCPPQLSFSVVVHKITTSLEEIMVRRLRIIWWDKDAKDNLVGHGVVNKGHYRRPS